MAKIKNAKVKTTSGGYFRIFNDEKLGKLLSKVQSTSISNGTELEKMLCNRSTTIENLDSFLNEVISNRKNGVYLCTKKVIKKSSYKLDKSEPDLIIFELKENGTNKCYIIELKDGDNFDTKKSKSELNSLKKYREHLGVKIQFITQFYICSFNQINKDLIVKGFKNEFSNSEVMTGKELCDLLNINYNDILNIRKEDAIDNYLYFIKELYLIDKIRKLIRDIEKKKIAEEDFYLDEE